MEYKSFKIIKKFEKLLTKHYRSNIVSTVDISTP